MGRLVVHRRRRRQRGGLATRRCGALSLLALCEVGGSKGVEGYRKELSMARLAGSLAAPSPRARRGRPARRRVTQSTRTSLEIFRHLSRLRRPRDDQSRDVGICSRGEVEKTERGCFDRPLSPARKNPASRGEMSAACEVEPMVAAAEELQGGRSRGEAPEGPSARAATFSTAELVGLTGLDGGSAETLEVRTMLWKR